MMYVIPIEFATPEYDAAVRLRYEVLRQPLGLDFTPEQLAEEFDQLHLAAFDGQGLLIGYLNLTPLDEKRVKMRQVAVAPGWQGRGVGREMVAVSETLASERGFTLMTLHARETAVPFYLKMNYQVVGDRFEEVTIPHFCMEKTL